MPYMSNQKAKRLLGYKDVVHPVDGLAETMRFLASHPPDDVVVRNLHDPLDYETEDKLVELWRQRDYKACMALEYPNGAYGFGHFYYGPIPNPGDEKPGDLSHKYAGKYDPHQLKRDKSKL
jgi:hypothetical protein